MMSDVMWWKKKTNENERKDKYGHEYIKVVSQVTLITNIQLFQQLQELFKYGK